MAPKFPKLKFPFIRDLRVSKNMRPLFIMKMGTEIRGKGSNFVNLHPYERVRNQKFGRHPLSVYIKIKIFSYAPGPADGHSRAL